MKKKRIKNKNIKNNKMIKIIITRLKSNNVLYLPTINKEYNSYCAVVFDLKVSYRYTKLGFCKQ